jgi:hypothetical protein
MGGLGAYFSIREKVNIGLECTDHLVNTDMVDATPGGFKFDAFVMLSLNITYNFNKYNPRKLPFVGPPAPPVVTVAPAPPVKPADTLPPPAAKKDTARVVPAPAPLPPPVKQETKPAPANPPATGLTFRVQVFAFRSDRYALQQVRDRYFPGEEVFKDFSGGWYRITVGNFATIEAARAKLAQLQKRGFKEAFITRYSNGTRIPPPYGKE